MKSRQFLTKSAVFDGASGDIGFTPKASNTNGLRAIKQQCLHQNRISALDFEGIPVMGSPFFLAKNRVGKASPLIVFIGRLGPMDAQVIALVNQ